MTKNANTSSKINGLSVDTIFLDDLSPTYTLSTTATSLSVGATGTNFNWGLSGSNGTSVSDWSNITISSSPTAISQDGQLDLRGNSADIRVNGRSLMDAITGLEQRLNLLVPNPELEAEWDELRELGERYRELEKKCKEKGEVWEKLKKMPPPKLD